MGGTHEKVAFVTGASRGIGRVAAVELARAGFRVAITARTLAAADERKLAGSLESTAAAVAEIGGEALALKVDLDDRDTITAAVETVLDAWGRIDVLVNNAFYQTWESQQTLVDMRMEHLDKQIRVNLLAPMFLAKLVLPQMLERGEGAIINLVSGAGVHEHHTAPAERHWSFGYGTSKVGMTEIAPMLVTQFGAQGIRSFSVQPGTVLTEQLQAALGEGTFAADDWTPPEHAARTIVWLATAPEALAMNGGLVSAPDLVHQQGLVKEART
jgi:NAD(P)-dependent dehydrogenase (short-subunit alcohol dehydrogenase family)